MMYMPPMQRRPGAGVVAVIRAVAFVLWLYFLGFFFAIAIGACLPLTKRRDPERRALLDTLIRTWSGLACFPFFSIKREGMENLPPSDKSCVFVANHQSFTDILSTLTIPRSFKYISKASIFKIPVIGWTMRCAGHIGLERADKKSQLEVFRQSMQKLENGSSLFIFPEGTRSKDGKMLDFKARGAFGFARRAKVPIVPITINGTGRIMPGGKEYCMYRSGAGVQLTIHPPITAEEVQELPDDELVARARTAVESALPKEYHSVLTSK